MITSDIMIDKWARIKLEEYDVPRPAETVLISIDFSTVWYGGCETCAYEEDVVEFDWDGGSFTLNERYDLGSVLREILDSGVDKDS